MSLFISRLSFAACSPFFPIALPMSPSFTTKMSLSAASTQSTTVVRVRSWNSATYCIVCSSNVTSAMRHLQAQDVRLPGAQDRHGGDGERHAARGAEFDVRPREPVDARVAQDSNRRLGAVRREDDELRRLRLEGPADLACAESHVPRVRGDLEGPRDVDHTTTSSVEVGDA